MTTTTADSVFNKDLRLKLQILDAVRSLADLYQDKEQWPNKQDKAICKNELSQLLRELSDASTKPVISIH